MARRGDAMKNIKNLILLGLVILTALIPTSAQTWGVIGLSGTGAGGAGSSYEIEDAFASDTSANYTKTSDSDAGASLSVSSGTAHSTNGYGARYYHETALSSVDHYSQITQSCTAGGDWSSPIVRVDDDSFYQVYLDGTKFKLRRVVNGSWTYLTTSSGDVADTNNHTVKLSASGSGATVTVTLTYDGNTWISYGDTDAARLTTGSYVGFIINRTNASGEPVTDNFIGDAL